MLPFFSLALWLLNTLQKEMQDKQSYSHIGTSAIKISRFILCTQFCFMFSTSSKLPWVLEQLWKLLLLSINSHSLFSVVFILIHMLVCISVWQNDKSIDWGRKMVLNLTHIVWWSIICCIYLTYSGNSMHVATTTTQSDSIQFILEGSGSTVLDNF